MKNKKKFAKINIQVLRQQISRLQDGHEHLAWYNIVVSAHAYES